MPHFLCFGLPTATLYLAPDDGLAHAAAVDREELVRLDAIVTDNYIAGSDPTLQVRAPDGVNWTIELAKRAHNREAGLTESQALPGDVVTVVGHRTQSFGEYRIKARHLTIGGRSFDLSAVELHAG